MRTAGTWTVRLGVAALALAIGWFDLWTVRSSGDPWKFGQEQRDYYNLLIDGWLDGQLHMKVEVPPALLAVPDPYDPALRPPGVALHDASFYHGRYYLYFGAGPIVTLMLPFRLITGIDLPQPVAVLVFAYGGFLAALATLLAIRRRYFLETGLVPTLPGVLALGLAGLGPVLLRRPQVWELPIAAAYCFAMLALFAVFRSLHSPRRSVRWLAAAALCLALAIASRPTYLVAIPLLAVPLIWIWRQRRGLPSREQHAASEPDFAALRSGRRPCLPASGGTRQGRTSPRFGLALVAAILPLAVIGSLMAWHNFARFGDPLQFGQTYQLSLDYEGKVQHFSPRYMPFNGWRYLFSPATWTRYYPFIHPAEVPPKPPGFGGHDDVYGVLANLPLAWLALAAPLATWRRSRQERGRLGAWLAAAAVLFGAVTALLLCFFGSLARYQLEFTPTLILLGCVGLLSLDRVAHSWPGGGARLGATLGGATLALFSAGFGVLFSLQLNRLLPERNPAADHAAARVLNRVPAFFEHVVGLEPAVWEIELKLPTAAPGRTETVLSLGNPPNVDRVFVRYRDERTVQVGFARDGMPDIEGRPRPLEPGKTHRLRIVLGGFLPPAEHPWFEGMPPDAARRASRVLRLEWDGEPLVETYRRFEATAGGRVRVGDRSLGKAAYPRFGGEVVAARRIALRATDVASLAGGSGSAAAGDTFALKLVFPAERAGACEPLVVTGATGQGDVLGVEYLDASRLRFVFDHWGSRLLQSEPLTLDFAREHDLAVQFMWLGSAGANRAESRGELRVRVDGRVVWQQTTMGYRADPEEVALGQNPIGGSNCGPAFTGRLLAAERVDH